MVVREGCVGFHAFGGALLGGWVLGTRDGGFCVAGDREKGNWGSHGEGLRDGKMTGMNLFPVPQAWTTVRYEAPGGQNSRWRRSQLHASGLSLAPGAGWVLCRGGTLDSAPGSQSPNRPVTQTEGGGTMYREEAT